MILTWDTPGLLWDDGHHFDATAGSRPLNQMKKIRLSLSKSAPVDTAQYADGLVESLTGNPTVTAPDPALTVLTSGAQAIRDKQAEIDAADAALDTKRGELVALNDTLKDSIRMLADHVEDKCNGDVDKLRSTGFSIVGDPQPRGPIGQVQNLRLRTANNEGQLIGRWKSVPGAASYVADLAENSEGPWTQAIITTRVSHTFTGLTPGTKYWVKVRALGTTGYGLWSDPACKMAA